jgi:hypothetical protein
VEHWLRRKFWKASSEKYIPADPSQRRLTLTGLKYFLKRRKQSRLQRVK